MAVLHTAATASCLTPIHQDWSDGGLTHCCYCLLSHTIPLIHSYTPGLIWWWSYTLLLLPLVTYNSSHSLLYIRTDLMAVLHTAAIASYLIQFLSFTPIHQDWSDGGLTHCCYCLLSHSYTSGLIWWRSYTLLLLPLVTYNSSHSLLYIRTDLMTVLHTAATASCLTPIHQDWSDGGLTHCCCCLLSHTIPLIHSYTPGLIWWRSYTLLLLPLVTYNSSHSLLYIRTDLMAVLHTAAIASCLIQFLSFTPIHQDWSDGGLTHCCCCLLSHTIPLIHSYTSGLIWWRSYTLLLLPLVSYNSSHSLLYTRTDLMAVLHTAAATCPSIPLIHSYTSGLIWWRSYTLLLLPLVTYNSSHSLLYIRTDLMAVLHTAATASWSDDGLTHCCYCLLSHSYTSGLIWWRSYTLLLLPLVTYNSSHSLLYTRTDLMVVLHIAAAASCHIQFLSFTPIHQDWSDGGLTHCCYCLLSHTIPLIHSYTPGLIWWRSYTLLLLPLVTYNSSHSLLYIRTDLMDGLTHCCYCLLSHSYTSGLIWWRSYTLLLLPLVTYNSSHSLLYTRTDLMAVLHTAAAASCHIQFLSFTPIHQDWSDGGLTHCCCCLLSHTIPLIHSYTSGLIWWRSYTLLLPLVHTIPLIHSYTSGLIWWRSYTLLLLPLVTYNSSHSLLYIRTDLMVVLHTAAAASCHIQFLSFTPIHQDWSDGGLTHCCCCLLSHSYTSGLIWYNCLSFTPIHQDWSDGGLTHCCYCLCHILTPHSYTSGLIWWRSYTLLLLPLVTYNSSHSLLYIRTDLMTVLHTAATASCLTPIHQDWSDGGLTHCCCCLLSHTIPLIHSYTSGLIWWRSYTLLLLPLVTYNSSHSLLYIRTDLMAVLHTAAIASCLIQFLSFTPIHQDWSDGGLTHCCCCLLSHTIPLIHSYTSGLIWWRSYTLLLLPLVSLLYIRTDLMEVLHTAAAASCHIQFLSFTPIHQDWSDGGLTHCCCYCPQFLSFTPIHQDWSDGGLTHCCCCLLSHTIPLIHSYTSGLIWWRSYTLLLLPLVITPILSGLIWWRSYTLLLLPLVTYNSSHSLLYIRTDLMAVLHTAATASCHIQFLSFTPIHQDWSDGGLTHCCYCLLSHTIPLIHSYTSGLIWWWSYTLLLLPLVTYNSSHSLLYIRTDLMVVLHTAAAASCHIQFLSFTPIHQDWSDGGLTHCCCCLLSHTIPLIHSYTSGLIWWRSYTLLLLPLVSYNSSHSLLYIRTDLMAVLHTAATASCLTPIHQDWSDGGLTHCCCCLLSHTIPLIHSYTSGLIWWTVLHTAATASCLTPIHQDWSDGGLTHCCYCLLSHTIPLIHSYTPGLIWWWSYTLLLLPLVTYNSSHSLLYIRTDLMAVLHTAAIASYLIQFLSFTPIHQDWSDGGLTHCCYCLLSHSYTSGLIWWRSYTLLLLPLVTYNSSHSLLYIRTDLMTVLHTAAAASCHIQFLSFTPIHQDWSDGGLTHCCCCLLSHTIPLIHSYTPGLIWWRSYTLLLLPLVTYNSSHSLLYIRTDLMAVLHTAAAASCLIQFLSFTPIHQDWSDGGLTHCCCCLLSHTIPLIHSYTSGLIWWRSYTLLLLPLVSYNSSHSLLYTRTDLMAVLHTAATASCHIQFLSFTPIHQDWSDGGLTHCCCYLSINSCHSLLYIRTDLMAVLHTAAAASCHIQFLSFTPIHQDWSDDGLTHCCYCLLSHSYIRTSDGGLTHCCCCLLSHTIPLIHSYTPGLIWWRSYTLLLLPLVTYNSSHSLLYIRTDLMAVLHTAATASCLTPIHQDWSDGGLTHCCCCLLSHTIPLIHSYTSGLIWWRSYTLLLLPLVSLLYIRTDLMAVLHTAAAASCHIQFLSLSTSGLIWWRSYTLLHCLLSHSYTSGLIWWRSYTLLLLPLVTYNSSHSLLYIRTDLMAVLHTAAAASCHIQFLSFTPIHQDWSDGGLTHCCYCLLSHTIPLIHSYTSGLIWWWSYTLLLLPLVTYNSSHSLLYIRTDLMAVLHTAATASCQITPIHQDWSDGGLTHCCCCLLSHTIPLIHSYTPGLIWWWSYTLLLLPLVTYNSSHSLLYIRTDLMAVLHTAAIASCLIQFLSFTPIHQDWSDGGLTHCCYCLLSITDLMAVSCCYHSYTSGLIWWQSYTLLLLPLVSLLYIRTDLMAVLHTAAAASCHIQFLSFTPIHQDWSDGGLTHCCYCLLSHSYTSGLIWWRSYTLLLLPLVTYNSSHSVLMYQEWSERNCMWHIAAAAAAVCKTTIRSVLVYRSEWEELYVTRGSSSSV